MIQADRVDDAQAIRYALMEALMESEQKLATSTVSYVLGISMGHAARVIRAYMSENPGAWEYSAASDIRAFIMTEQYARIYLDESSNEDRYLEAYCNLIGMDREDLTCYQEV